MIDLHLFKCCQNIRSESKSRSKNGRKMKAVSGRCRLEVKFFWSGEVHTRVYEAQLSPNQAIGLAHVYTTFIGSTCTKLETHSPNDVGRLLAAHSSNHNWKLCKTIYCLCVQASHKLRTFQGVWVGKPTQGTFGRDIQEDTWSRTRKEKSNACETLCTFYFLISWLSSNDVIRKDS